MNIAQLREQLKIDEGVKYEIYKDHLGYDTFGIGHLVVKEDAEFGQSVGTKVSEDRVNEVFEKDVQKMIKEAKILFPNFDSLPEEAQQVIVNMTFNMGRPRLSNFKKFIAYINESKWEEASKEMLNSAWAKQVGKRAQRLSDRIKIIK
jgi:GH24 family phage-related lysozyme (muramidase)